MALPFTKDADDRRTCATCTQIGRYGPCQAARRGDIIASRNYEPDRQQLRRCEGYLPDKSDPDQRTGRQRWPLLNYQPTREKSKK